MLSEVQFTMYAIYNANDNRLGCISVLVRVGAVTMAVGDTLNVFSKLLTRETSQCEIPVPVP